MCKLCCVQAHVGPSTRTHFFSSYFRSRSYSPPHSRATLVLRCGECTVGHRPGGLKFGCENEFRAVKAPRGHATSFFSVPNIFIKQDNTALPSATPRVRFAVELFLTLLDCDGLPLLTILESAPVIFFLCAQFLPQLSLTAFAGNWNWTQLARYETNPAIQHSI